MVDVLVIEDDFRVREALARALADRGHAVDTVASGMEGVERVVNASPQIVVLDLGLPDLDGSEVLKMIRAVSAVPVIVATARDDEAEVIKLLNAGADDYVVKPFSSSQLEARIRAVNRRTGGETGDGTVVVGELTIDTDGRVASLEGQSLELTRMEFDLLAYLASNVGRVVSKRELLGEVWRQPYGGADKTVDVHLSWLRKKMGESAASPQYLHTVRGVGVKLEPPS